MRVPEIVPTPVGSLLVTALRLYYDNLRTFFSMGLVVLGPIALASAVANAVVTHLEVAANVSDPGFSASWGHFVQWQDRMSRISQITWGTIFLASFVVGGALAYAVSRRYLGRSVTVGGAYRAILPRLPYLLGAAIALVLIAVVEVMFLASFVLGAVIACGVAVWLAFSLAFVAPVIVVERQGIDDAISRSRFLIKGSWWRVFLTLVVVVGVTAAAGVSAWIVASASVGWIDSHAAAEIITSLVPSVINLVVTPYVLIVITRLYFGQRARKEGFDLSALANELGETGDRRQGLAQG